MPSLDEVIDEWADRVEIHEGPDRFMADFMALPPMIQPLIAGAWCEYEVSNGGLHQFFSNSTGVLAPEAIAAFETIGIPDLATVVRDAAGLFGEPYPRDREKREEALEGALAAVFKTNLSQLDDRFYSALGDSLEAESTWRVAASAWLARTR